MITNLLFCISSPDVTCLHVLQAPWINALRGRGTHSATTTFRLCRLMCTCIAATRKVSHVFIYTYKLKVSGAHAPLGPTVDTPLDPESNHSEATVKMTRKRMMPQITMTMMMRRKIMMKFQPSHIL